MANVSEVFPDETQIHAQVNLIFCCTKPTARSSILGPASLWFGLFNLGDNYPFLFFFFIVHYKRYFQSQHNERDFEESGLVFNMALLK